MAASSIQGQMLEVTVVSCNRLKDVEWFTRQDPYVCIEYGSTKFKTRAHTDGGKQPNFQEKFHFSLIEGLREMNVSVLNSNTIFTDESICSGKVLLHKVLSKGFDDSTWPLHTTSGRYGGELRIIMHYANAIDIRTGPSAPPYGPAAAPHVQFYTPPQPFAPQLYAVPPPPPPPHYQYPSPYPPNPTPYPPYLYQYPPQPTAYPPQPAAYPPQPAAYPPQPYPPQVYPPQPYPPAPPATGYYPPPEGPYYARPYQ
ncbi:hypothetical protein ACHQM5_006597 [Ranunculus cassubicifolius]